MAFSRTKCRTVALTDRVVIRGGGGGDSRGRGGVLVVVICGDVVDGRGVVLDGVALRAVAVVRWGEHHRRLVCLRVLMVEVDHASAAVRDSRHAVRKRRGGAVREEGTGLQQKDKNRAVQGKKGRREEKRYKKKKAT